ncbi:hypothetical protein HMPREF0083_01365 [Aneurinibacillus aneurinilyticus ATCC 12856]|uniref:Uncharacterized protein n=1 Tax=Aneurinibacillus aneurinilyticus ATCC 12856 TaxID=649747 RepID=U1X658_ANEAE|nr:hypothetical protein HMPREF0083_01365 [Aneurinibacillus aneurinilyticus ATCC 12856]
MLLSLWTAAYPFLIKNDFHFLLKSNFFVLKQLFYNYYNLIFFS